MVRSREKLSGVKTHRWKNVSMVRQAHHDIFLLCNPSVKLSKAFLRQAQDKLAQADNF